MAPAPVERPAARARRPWVGRARVLIVRNWRCADRSAVNASWSSTARQNTSARTGRSIVGFVPDRRGGRKRCQTCKFFVVSTTNDGVGERTLVSTCVIDDRIGYHLCPHPFLVVLWNDMSMPRRTSALGWTEEKVLQISTDLVVRSSQALCQRTASGHWECIWRQWSGWKDTVVVQIRKVIVVDQRRLPTLLQPRRASMDSSSVVIPTDSSSSAIAPVSAQQPRRKIPKVQFRVLIIGRANAGKTSILQRVCDTTKSPVIYRGKEKEEEVRGPKVMFATLISLPTRLNLSHLWMLVSMYFFFGCL